MAMCATLLLTVATSFAANKLDIKTITDGTFRGESLSEVRALDEAGTYAQISADGKQIVKYSYKTGKQLGTLFDADKAKGAKLERVEGYVMSPKGDNILIQTQTKQIYRHSFTAVYYIYNVASNKLTPLSDGGPQQTPLWSPDGNSVAFVREGNIFLVKLLYDNAESQVTKDGKFNSVINGIPDWVNEEEFSNDRSMVFTADSKQICWIRYDESDVKQYSMQLFRGMAPEKEEYEEYPGFYTYKYPVAGEDNAKVSVHSFDIKSRQTRTIDVPLDTDGYIPRIKATTDPTKVAVYTLNRHQDCLNIYMCNPLTTVCQLVIQDKIDKYVREGVVDQVLITDKHILLPSDRDGYTRLYLYTIGGQLKRTIGTGEADITAVYGYDEATGDVYFASNPKGATERGIYVSHANGKVEALTQETGYNSAIFSKDYKYFLNTWSDLDNPTVYSLKDNKGKTTATLVDNKALKEKMESYAQGKRELFSFTTADGVKLNGWMVKPRNFDPSRKYPVIMYQYGGPGNQQVLNRWGNGMCGQGAVFEQYLAQEGFIAVCVDNRGTGGRGADFEKCTYLHLGQLEAHDQVETAIWLGQQGYVDKSRIAIWGWSYGGWNTLMSMSEGRQVFRCGVAIAPPTSYRYYDTVYTERFMRTPKENPDGYNDNPITRASKLSGALLICHGLADDNVHFRNTAEYSEALVQADKDFKMNVYTNRNHSIYGGNTRNHLFRQAVNFFKENMGGSSSTLGK